MKTNIIFSLAIISFLSSCKPSTEELYAKADRLIEKKQFKDAIKVYDRILDRNPRMQDAVYGKGFCHLQDSNYIEALGLFQKVLKMKTLGNGTFIFEKNADSPFALEEDKHQVDVKEIYFQMGVTKFYMDSLTASYQHFQHCIERNYRKAECFELQGQIWLWADSLNNACLLFQKAKLAGSGHADTLLSEYCAIKPEK